MCRCFGLKNTEMGGGGEKRANLSAAMRWLHQFIAFVRPSVSFNSFVWVIDPRRLHFLDKISGLHFQGFVPLLLCPFVNCDLFASVFDLLIALLIFGPANSPFSVPLNEVSSASVSLKWIVCVPPFVAICYLADDTLIDHLLFELNNYLSLLLAKPFIGQGLMKWWINPKRPYECLCVKDYCSTSLV